ncbi:hypothetical protein [Marinobacter salinexigens]|uniref:hypothetical protein n=1 Tax=Marinobacter salinexigens TaxID=2919747 RepID=UPI00165F557E|nr:hypothetical protein [Marinobacter salinexigens]
MSSSLSVWRVHWSFFGPPAYLGGVPLFDPFYEFRAVKKNFSAEPVNPRKIVAFGE